MRFSQHDIPRAAATLQLCDCVVVTGCCSCAMDTGLSLLPSPAVIVLLECDGVSGVEMMIVCCALGTVRVAESEYGEKEVSSQH